MKCPQVILLLLLCAAPVAAEEAEVACPVQQGMQPQHGDLCRITYNEISRLRREIEALSRNKIPSLKEACRETVRVNDPLIAQVLLDAERLYRLKQYKYAVAAEGRAHALQEEIATVCALLSGAEHVLVYYRQQKENLERMRESCNC